MPFIRLSDRDITCLIHVAMCSPTSLVIGNGVGSVQVQGVSTTKWYIKLAYYNLYR